MLRLTNFVSDLNKNKNSKQVFSKNDILNFFKKTYFRAIIFTQHKNYKMETLWTQEI